MEDLRITLLLRTLLDLTDTPLTMDGDEREGYYQLSQQLSDEGGGGGRERGGRKEEEKEERKKEQADEDPGDPGDPGEGETGTGNTCGGIQASRSRDNCITQRYYCGFVIVMLLVVVLVIIACLCSANKDYDEIIAPSHCPKGTFQCESSKTCINETLRCNQVVDCDDGTDEGSECDKLRDWYYDTSYKKRPDADFDRLDSFCVLENVPKNCTCNNLTNLYCENSFTHHLPPIPTNVTHLASHLGNLPYLKKLIVMHSGVKRIENGAFARMPALERVYLTDNKLTRVPGKAFNQNSNIFYLSLTDNRINSLQLEDLQSLQKLEIFDLSDNRLEVVRSSFFNNLPNLLALFLSFNGMYYIEPGSFGDLNRLYYLDLSNNRFRHIPSGIFAGLSNLTNLKLEHNGIRTIDVDAFAPLINAESVQLLGNHLRNLSQKTFSYMQRLNYIYFDKFYLCVYAQHADLCLPLGDGISSQSNLLDNVVLRVCLWVVAVLACVGNVLVFMGRFLLREDNQIHSFFIKNLSLADLLMGVYLLIIGAQDLKFRGQYILHDETWRNSKECDMCGVLSTLSTEMSVLTLCVITLDRYISIMYPLSFRKRGLKTAYGAMGCTWLVCLLLALLPVVGFEYFGSQFFRDNGVCVPLHIHEPKTQGWEYSSFLFLGVNLASFAFIAYAYTAMFWSIHKSAIPLRTSRESKERCLVKRFFFIVITDFLCWIPIIIIKVIALSGVYISAGLYAWVIVFILPVNSALNPLLYTLTTKLFKQTLLSKFNSVVWRPTIIKDGSLTSRASVRGNSSGLNRNPLQDVELEMLRRHGCYKNGGVVAAHGVAHCRREEGREPHTSTTTLASSPASHSWCGNSSPTRTELMRNGHVISNEYTQI